MPRSALIWEMSARPSRAITESPGMPRNFISRRSDGGGLRDSASVPFNNSFLQRIHCPALGAHCPLAFHVKTDLPFTTVRFPDVQDEVGYPTEHRSAARIRLALDLRQLFARDREISAVAVIHQLL